jgi:hypothetical protein
MFVGRISNPSVPPGRIGSPPYEQISRYLAAFSFGSEGLAIALAVGVVTASDVEGEAEQSGEGGDGALVARRPHES